MLGLSPLMHQKNEGLSGLSSASCQLCLIKTMLKYDFQIKRVPELFTQNSLNKRVSLQNYHELFTSFF
jgi:hypothetical protein